MGDWKNNSRPSIMLGTRTATDAYLQYSINEYTRVPLYELVYHDELISHRFVSRDRKVQETRFSSGKRAVVNFGDTPYTFEGQIIEPRGFLTKM